MTFGMIVGANVDGTKTMRVLVNGKHLARSFIEIPLLHFCIVEHC
jgi:hypothetical protein